LLQGIKSTLIYPATEKHLVKYTSQNYCIVNESPSDYENIVLPHIQSSSFSRQVWSESISFFPNAHGVRSVYFQCWL